MSEPMTMLTVASLSLLGLTMCLFAGLRAWQGWLDLKRLELGGSLGAGASGRGTGNMAERIELADLKERIRKLEAIAACVDL